MDIVSTFSNTSWLAIILAALGAFLVGAAWYGPIFGKVWLAEFGFTDEDLAKRNYIKIFSGTFLLNIVMACNLAMFLGPKAGITFGAIAGFFTGLGFTGALLGVFYLFEGRSARLFLINSGFAIVSFMVMGIVIGALN